MGVWLIRILEGSLPCLIHTHCKSAAAQIEAVHFPSLFFFWAWEDAMPLSEIVTGKHSVDSTMIEVMCCYTWSRENAAHRQEKEKSPGDGRDIILVDKVGQISTNPRCIKLFYINMSQKDIIGSSQQ